MQLLWSIPLSSISDMDKSLRDFSKVGPYDLHTIQVLAADFNEKSKISLTNHKMQLP